ncbi:glycosyltransferase [Patescibacteria group bacterium]
MKKLKILIVSSLALDTGSAIRASNIAKALKKAGVIVDFIKPYSKTLAFKLDFLLTLPRYFLRVIFSKADYVLTVKSYPNVGIPILIKKLLGGKIIIDTDDLSYAYSTGIWNFFSKICQELFIPLASLHTYHNPRLRKYLVNKLNISINKTYQLKQGVDLGLFKANINSKQQNLLIKKFKLKNKKILVYTGHFDIACDLKYILKAMPMVFKNNPEVRLVVIGDGKRKKEFQLLSSKLGIDKNIIWVGSLLLKKVSVFLNLADICLLYYQPKKANLYRSSLKIREYLALGKKVVCNNVGELKNFKDYTYQTTSRLIDYSKMIQKVLTGLNDNRQKKGEVFIKKEYNWEMIARNFISRLQTLT